LDGLILDAVWMAPENSTYVFISYVSEDAARVDHLQDMLEAAGLKVWRDKSALQPGDNWRIAINDAIGGRCVAFIACFSEHSDAKAISYQNYELTQAVEQARLRVPGAQWMFPVRFDDCRVPPFDLGSGHDLRSLQSVDLFGRPWGPEVARLVAAVRGVADAGSDRLREPALPVAGTAVGKSVGDEFAGAVLSADVEDRWRSLLVAEYGASRVPNRWTITNLDKLRLAVLAENGSTSKALDVLTALCQALGAKPVFAWIGGADLELGQLQALYRREINCWPAGRSADALLVEAADVSIQERREGTGGSLCALARFVLGVAAAQGVSPTQDAYLSGWIESLGHQLGDAADYFNERNDQPAWLFIDLGDEPGPDSNFWPGEVTWMQLGRDHEVIGQSVRCEQTAEDVRRAMSDVIRLAPPARQMLVDLVVPRVLMDQGIEQWSVVDVDGELEALSVRYHPRLRWSRRRRDARLHNRLLERVREASSWDGSARHWRCSNPGHLHPCFVGGSNGTDSPDLLRDLLREGYGFVIWFPAGLTTSAARKISRAVERVPVAARRRTLPDWLPDLGGDKPAVIWDDPSGREGIRLPPPVVPESP
jgi:TIR domain/vWA-MoxR associated protein C-terminal domain